jgi:mRNA interferase HigB
MRVIAKKALVVFYSLHNGAKVALEDWYDKTESSDWEDFADVRRTFGSVDAVGNKRFVFNIKGNQYRLVALILFKTKMVYVRFIGTHDEYDRIKNIENI